MSEPTRGPATELPLEECYREAGKREFEREWPPSLRKSLTHCHDVNRALIREKSRQDGIIDRQWLWIKILGAAVAGAWALVVGLVVLLLDMAR